MLSDFKKYTYIFITIICWGLSYPLTKSILNYMSPIIVAFIRAFVGGVILLILVRKIIYGRKELLNAVLNVASLLIFLNLGIYFAINPGLASVMLYTQPVFTVIISRLYLKEKISNLSVIGIVLAFLGIFISANSLEFDLGVLFALLGGFIWAIGTIYHSRNFKNHDLLKLHTFMSLISSLFILPLIPVGYHFDFSVYAIVLALILTIIAQVIGYMAWFRSISEIGPINSGTLSLLVPITAYSLTYLILGIKPTLFTIAGSSITLLGIFLTMRSFISR